MPSTQEVQPTEKVRPIQGIQSSTPSYAPLADQVVILTGPTASGKSAIGIELAERIEMGGRKGGEIISIDSIAVYQGMDIGTAKPTKTELDRVPHHLIDVVSPTTSYSVADYLKAAHEIVAKITDRGRVPIFVGGTPMYLKGILRGFDPGPPADQDFRLRVERDVEKYGVDALRERLTAVDPLSAWKIDRQDVRRMIRALEVAHVTGIPISHRQTQFDTTVEPGSIAAFWFHWDRSELHRRIEARTKSMFEHGFVDEVQRLLQKHGALSETAASAVGYREVIELIQSNQDHQSEAVDQCMEEVTAHTRRLARRQETWLRGLGEIQKIEMTPPSQSDVSQSGGIHPGDVQVSENQNALELILECCAKLPVGGSISAR